MNILPNTIVVFPDSFDSMKQFSLELKYTTADYTVYELGEREYDNIEQRLLATGIPFIYVPETLNKSVCVNSYKKVDGNIIINQQFIPLTSLISFDMNQMNHCMDTAISKEQARLGNKYSIVQLLSGE